MKLNKEICNEFAKSGYKKIYNLDKARRLFKEGKFTYRQLSLMKQENIRVMGKGNATLRDLKLALEKKCGYCFRYDCWDKYTCPLYKKNNVCCAELPFAEHMVRASTKKEFLMFHKLWCQELGLWKKSWE